MRKNGLLVLCLLVALILPTIAFGKTVTLSFATEVPYLPLERSDAAADLIFNSYLQDNFDFKIEYFPAAQLGDQVSNYQQVCRNQIQMTKIQSSIVAGINAPNFFIFDVPYLFTDWGIALRTLAPGSELVDGLSDYLVKKAGARILTAIPVGYRELTNNVRLVKKPADLKGLKIRTMQAPAHIAAWKAAGANPTPMGFLEVYSALQTGVIDGQENPIPVFMGNSFQEVQKYLTLTRHVMSVELLLINDKFYQSLSQAQKNQIGMAAELYFSERALEVMKQASLQLTDIQNKKQMTVYNPTAAEIEQFRTVMQPPASEYIKGQLDDVKWLDLLYAEIARVEKEF